MKKRGRKAQSTYGLIILIVAIAALVIYVDSEKKLSPPVKELAVAPETLDGVGLEGTRGDGQLNREKNRYTAPVDVEELSVSQFLDIPAAQLVSAGRRWRANWPGSAIDYAEKEEHRGVRVIGYLVHAKESGPESCNGYSDSLRDYHIWIADTPTTTKANGMIVEITPRWMAVRPSWRLRTLAKLAQQHSRVRVTGWLMWDEEHPDEVGKSRATQWEVHPVTNFEVFDNGNWSPLEQN